MSFFGDLFKLLSIGAFFAATGPFGLSIAPALATWLRIGGYVLGYVGATIDKPDQIKNLQQYRMRLEPGSALPVVYGRAKVGGIVDDWFVDKVFGGQVLYMAVPMCHGSRDGSGVATVEEIWINGLLGVTTSGDLRHNFFIARVLDYHVFLGSDSQNIGTTDLTGLDVIFADKSLSDASANWSATTDTGKGIACVVFRMLNAPRAGQSDILTFSGPPSFAFIITGNTIYDTRSSTWVSAGSNPAMCLRDYLLSPIYGCGYDVSLIHEQSFKDAADYCDQSQTYLVIWSAVTVNTSSVANPSTITTATNHNFQTGDGVKISGHTGSTPNINGVWVATRTGATTFTIPVNVTVGGTGGTVTKVHILPKRYTCNGVVDTSRSTAENIDALKSSCRGQLVWEQGQFKLTIRNGSPPAATVALTPSNIIGQWSFRNAGVEDKWNIVKATYIHPMNGEFKSQETQWPPVGVSNAYLTADNSFVNRLDMTLPFTNDQTMAQDICQIMLNERRLGITAQCRCTEAILAASVGDLVTVTHPTPGWNVKPFWLTALDILPDGTVGVSLQEYDSTAYDPGTLEDIRTFPATTLIPQVAPPVDFVFNGDFEGSASLDSWTVRSGTGVLDTVHPYAGVNDLHITATAATSTTVEQTDYGTTTTSYSAVLPGQGFRLTAVGGFVTGATGVGTDARVNVIFYDSGHSSLSSITAPPAWVSWSTETVYTLKSVDVVAPVGAAWVGFTVTVQVVVSGTAQFYVDDIHCVPHRR